MKSFLLSCLATAALTILLLARPSLPPDMPLVTLERVIGMYFHVDSSVDTKGPLIRIRRACEDGKARECWLVAFSGPRGIVAAIDVTGKWHKFASDEEIAGVLATLPETLERR